jgi:hypothetical protein
MKNLLSLLFVAIATILFVSSPTLVGAESEAACSSEEGECENPDVVVADDAAEEEEESEPIPEVEVETIEEDPNCPSRDLIIRCAALHLDKNKNGKIDRPELQGAIDSLPWFARGILKILGSVDKMVSCVCWFLPTTGVCVCGRNNTIHSIPFIDAVSNRPSFVGNLLPCAFFPSR